MSSPTLRPATVPELVDAVRAARSDGTRLVPVGGGAAVAFARPDAAESHRLDLSALGQAFEAGIVEYVQGDGTVTLHASARMADVARVVAAGGHRLTPRLPARDANATIGGVLGMGTSGLDRSALGPLRHHVLGLTFIDGTGRVARSGGRLVKNVTGFDLHRLLVGARGSLGAVLEVSLRLFPAPEEELTFAADLGDLRSAVETALEIHGAPGVRPRLLFVRGTRVFVGLAGRRAQVAAEASAVRARGAGDGVPGEAPAADAIDAGAPAGGATWSFGVRPSRCLDVLEALERAGAQLADVLVEPAVARITLPGEALAGGSGADFGALLGTGARILDAPPAGLPEHPPGGFLRGPHAFEARLRAAFDPDGVFGVPARSASHSIGVQP